MAVRELSKLLSDMENRISDIRKDESSKIASVRDAERGETGSILNKRIKVNQTFLDRKSAAEKRKIQLNAQFADATSKVLNEDTLRFLDTHANIVAPTFTSIFAGFERARASSAERRERALKRTVEGIDTGLGISANRANLELTELSTELKDVRSNADDLVKAIESGADAESSIERFKVQELNRRKGSGKSEAVLNLEGLLNAAGSTPQAAANVQPPSLTPDQRLANVVVQPSNELLFESLGIPEDRQPLAQMAYDQALLSPLNEIDPNYAVSFVARGFRESAYDPNAIGGIGEEGLFQLRPSTAVEVGVVNSFDPLDNITGALRYDVANAERLRNNGIEVTIRNIGSAFNAGPGATIRNGGETASAREYLNRIDADSAKLSSLTPSVVSNTPDAQTPVVQEIRNLNENITPVAAQPLPVTPDTRFVSTGDDLPDANNLPDQSPAANVRFISTGDDLPTVDDIPEQPLVDDTRFVSTGDDLPDANNLPDQSPAASVRFVSTGDDLPAVNDIPELNNEAVQQRAVVQLNTALDNLSEDVIRSANDVSAGVVMSDETIQFVQSLNEISQSEITPERVQIYAQNLGVEPSTLTPVLLQKLLDDQEELENQKS